MLRRRILLPLIAGVTLVACQDATVAPSEVDSAEFKRGGGGGAAAVISAMMDEANAGFAAAGVGYRVAMAEYVTGSGNEAGATVISKNVGNKQLGFDFVPFDALARRLPMVAGADR